MWRPIAYGCAWVTDYLRTNSVMQSAIAASAKDLNPSFERHEDADSSATGILTLTILT